MVGGAVASVGLAGIGTIGVASAATDTTSDPQNSIIEKIASKFNLNKDEVKKVFDDEHAARHKERQARVKTELAQLVKDGKLTQEQADKIIAKSAELKAERDANREAIKDKTEAERKTIMDTKRDELKKWLSDNGIDESYIRYVAGGGPGRGPGDFSGRHGRGGDNAPDSGTDISSANN